MSICLPKKMGFEIQCRVTLVSVRWLQWILHRIALKVMLCGQNLQHSGGGGGHLGLQEKARKSHSVFKNCSRHTYSHPDAQAGIRNAQQNCRICSFEHGSPRATTIADTLLKCHSIPKQSGMWPGKLSFKKHKPSWACGTHCAVPWIPA